jgi:hypothetical protein
VTVCVRLYRRWASCTVANAPDGNRRGPYLNGDTADLVAELPVQDLVVLRSAKHLLGLLIGLARLSGRDLRADLHMVAIGQAATGALATSGSGESDVAVANLVEDAAVNISVVAAVGVSETGLAEGDSGLEHRALHVVDEDGEVARLAVGQLAPEAVVGGRVLGGSVCVLTVATLGDVGGVEGATVLAVGRG